jgi:hypothetical protein
VCRIAQQRAKILENTANYVKIVSEKGERRRKVCSAKNRKKPLTKGDLLCIIQIVMITSW